MDASRIRVVVRVRPPIKEDYEHSYGEYEECIRVNPMNGETEAKYPSSKYLTVVRAHSDERDFLFDLVLPPEVDQDGAYTEIGDDVVSDVLQGFNGTIMAYGQTGTGKTHTIFGDTSSYTHRDRAGRGVRLSTPDSGIIPRAVQHIFDHIDSASDTEFQVTLSYLQLYKESVYDLLSESAGTTLPLREGNNGVYVDGLTAKAVSSGTHLMDLIGRASAHRVMAGTSMNQLSSRSHVIMFVTVEQRPAGGGPADPVRRGVLCVVDLAGSERVSKTMSEGSRLDEAKKINQSLSALGNCVSALSAGHTHVPFRDSKLTRLLTDSLGGNSKTVLCATVGPAECHYDETYSTLLFASRCMDVATHAVINEVADFKALHTTLQEQLAHACDRNAGLQAQNDALEARLAAMEGSSQGQAVPCADGNGGAAFGGAEREREVLAKFSDVIVRMQGEIRAQRAAADAEREEERKRWRALAETLASHPQLAAHLDLKEPASESESEDDEDDDSDVDSDGTEGPRRLTTPATLRPATPINQDDALGGALPATYLEGLPDTGVTYTSGTGTGAAEGSRCSSPQSIFEDDLLTDSIRRSARLTHGSRLGRFG